MAYKFPGAFEVLGCIPLTVRLCLELEELFADAAHKEIHTSERRNRYTKGYIEWSQYDSAERIRAVAYVLGVNDVWDNRMRDTSVRNRTIAKSKLGSRK